MGRPTTCRNGRTSSGSASRPGSTCPGETEGLVPSKKWRDELFAEGETERPWSAGDNIQLATGQGDLQTDPLQMAIAYAALGNGGTIVTPHVGHGNRGRRRPGAEGIRPAAAPPGQDRPRLPRQAILEGLHEAAQVPRRHLVPASSAASRSRSPARPGPRNAPGHADQSWYAVLAPYPDPQYRHDRDHRGRRLRRRIRGARPRCRSSKRTSTSRPSRSRRRERRRRMSYATRTSAPGRRAVRRRASASPSASASPTWTGRWPSPPSAWSPSASSPSARRPPTTSPADPDYYLDRQAIYAVLGVVGMLLLTRIDYSRFRELRVGIYTFLCVSDLARLRLRLRRPRLAARLRTSLLHLPAVGARQAPARAGPCRVRHRRRQARLAEAAHGALPRASAWPRRHSSSCSPTSAPRWCSWSPPSP